MSMIIPTHNWARKIGEVVDSALKQGDQSKEMIVAQDGSATHRYLHLVWYLA